MENIERIARGLDFVALTKILATIAPLIPVPGAATVGAVGGAVADLLAAKAAAEGKEIAEILDGVGIKADGVEAKALIRMAELRAQLAASGELPLGGMDGGEGSGPDTGA